MFLSAALGLAAGALKASELLLFPFRNRWNDGEEDGESVPHQNNDAGQPGVQLVSGHIQGNSKCILISCSGSEYEALVV